MSEVTSFRLDEVQKARLVKIAQLSGKTLGEVVREMLRDPRLVVVVAEAEKRGYMRGAKDWQGKAYIACKFCGKAFTVDFVNDPAVAQTVRKAFSNWGHTECIRVRREQTSRRLD